MGLKEVCINNQVLLNESMGTDGIVNYLKCFFKVYETYEVFVKNDEELIKVGQLEYIINNLNMLGKLELLVEDKVDKDTVLIRGLIGNLISIENNLIKTAELFFVNKGKSQWQSLDSCLTDISTLFSVYRVLLDRGFIVDFEHQNFKKHKESFEYNNLLLSKLLLHIENQDTVSIADNMRFELLPGLVETRKVLEIEIGGQVDATE